MDVWIDYYGASISSLYGVNRLSRIVRWRKSVKVQTCSAEKFSLVNFTRRMSGLSCIRRSSFLGRVISVDCFMKHYTRTSLTFPVFRTNSSFSGQNFDMVVVGRSVDTFGQDSVSESLEFLQQASTSFTEVSLDRFAFPFSLPGSVLESFNILAGSHLRSLTELWSISGQLRMQLAETVFDSSRLTLAVATLILITGTTIFSLSNRWKKTSFVEGEDIPLKYDPIAIAHYFEKRQVGVFLRAAKIMSECFGLSVHVLFDVISDTYSKNENLRARQLVELISRLGPTAIKIGQALSIRPDILSIAYLEELQKLQDRVPPFPNEDAEKIIHLELGMPVSAVFSEMSGAPVAAASVGQVYQAKLRESGHLVAVKVQRPGILEGISLDLFLLRAGAYFFQSFPGVQSDLVGLLDNWAVRFYDELDYVQEAKNQTQFLENMKFLPKVTVPAVYSEYTTRKVLMTEWVEGEKLSDCKKDDLLPLVSTALNCYLGQLLESGFLHADPHPGNLLRMRDGRLCVLDFGLMTQVTEDQRYSLIEYISHLIYSDYERVAEDLVRLGFVPQGLEDPEKTAAIVPHLSKVLGELVRGGGIRKINIQEVTDNLVSMSKEFVFVLPPYFILILRAFSVLEGIGLEADPDYTIVAECYPYIAKRLLTDDSPRAQAALKYFLYGGQRQLNVSRVEGLVQGFLSFRESMAVGHYDKDSNRTLQYLDESSKDVLKLIFAPNGSYVQDLFLTELARSVDALSREGLAELWRLISAYVKLLGIPLPVAVLAPRSWPLPIPGFLFGITRVATLSEEDQRSLDAVKRLWTLAEPVIFTQSPFGIFQGNSEAFSLFVDIFPGITVAAQRFMTILIQRQALRFADDLDGTNSVEEWNRDSMASARNIQPAMLFSLLRRDRVD